MKKILIIMMILIRIFVLDTKSFAESRGVILEDPNGTHRGYVVKIRTNEGSLSGAFWYPKNVETGSLKEASYQLSLADDETVTLESITNGAKGWFIIGNNEERVEFSIDNDGDVLLHYNSPNVTYNADTDTKFCIGTSSTQEPLIIKNRLGATKNIIGILEYY